jgi:hypothetical protein
MYKLNPSIKHHLIIGVLTMVWGFVFAFFIRPFEHGYMNDTIWLRVSVGFSIAVFTSYGFVTIVQWLLYKKRSRWNLFFEIATYFVFYCIYSVTTYLYYKGSIVKGFYDFPEFFSKIILNIILILTPILFLARRYSIKLIPIKEEEITLKGDNKLDILKIKKSELICISNAQNYVEIFYLEGNILKTKLIRSTLKKLQHEFDFLVQIHRSHLINPDHFKSWKDSATIELTQVELPVSKSYKNRLSHL